jgi:hypothetical protein
MNTKLTLSIEEEIIIKAKAFAKDNGKSLSQLIENYLSALVNHSSQVVEEPSLLYSLKGSFKDKELIDYKQQLKGVLGKKYLNE